MLPTHHLPKTQVGKVGAKLPTKRMGESERYGPSRNAKELSGSPKFGYSELGRGVFWRVFSDLRNISCAERTPPPAPTFPPSPSGGDGNAKPPTKQMAAPNYRPRRPPPPRPYSGPVYRAAETPWSSVKQGRDPALVASRVGWSMAAGVPQNITTPHSPYTSVKADPLGSNLPSAVY